ncbi:MAG: hypothetical protein WC910_10930, partial [Bacteroidales bacterium]
MKYKTVNIQNCNDCPFVINDKDTSFCAFNNLELPKKNIPLIIGRKELIHPLWCYLRRTTIT